MATSGTYAITMTASSMITKILQELGEVASGDTPESNDTDIVLDKINLWLLQQNGPNNTMRSGDMMWTRETGTMDLDTTKIEYDLKPSGGDLDIQIPNELLAVYYRDTADDTDTLLESMTLKEWSKINDKDAVGKPGRYYYEKRLDTGKLTLDYKPEDDDELIIHYKQPLEVITATSETFDIDPSWYRALLYNVAVDCASTFGVGANNPRFQTIMMLATQSMGMVNSFFKNSDPIQTRPA
jgi:hypothetical protein